MNDVTRILAALEIATEKSQPYAAEQLLPLLYDELRQLAAHKLADERPGQTLQPTALVHEAYLRVVGPDNGRRWDGRGHFFAAAAEAMRRILIERARHKSTAKRSGAGGGGRDGERVRLDLDQITVVDEARRDELLAVDEALGELERHDAQAAQLVKLRYFAGLTHQEAAEAMNITRRAADRLWALARAWLFRRIGRD